MGFRLRDVETDDLEVVHAADARYREHLRRFDTESNGTLWKYFYWDFFHDGWLTRFSVGDDLRTVELSIVCPNIERFDDTGAYECVDAAFDVELRHVVELAMSVDPPGAVDEELCCATLLYTEINTSPLAASLSAADPDGVQWCSLMIEFDLGGPTLWLEAVFRDVSVVPQEPVAFSAMEADPRFKIGTYPRP
ncbi:MAG: hypothetical protein CVT59_00975 [Actinobacteria bacterium HGW-Actinobacteria-1]|nr:MAG: hypothetical protein CVT59_00975 [Actinobacteria bacterium HGW-Actinobacteria-1]